MGTKANSLIPAQRCEDEGLDFIEERTVDDQGITHVDYKIIDAAGVVYNAMLLSDGTVCDGYMTYANSKTFEPLQGPVDTLCGGGGLTGGMRSCVTKTAKSISGNVTRTSVTLGL